MAFLVNVPRAPGVPNVNFAAEAGSVVSLLLHDATALFFGIAPGLSWGIYLGGFPVVVADTVTSFDYRQQWSLSDYPVERGAFETYDKVQIPYDARFRFAAGGSEGNRQALLDSIAAIAGDYNLYDVVTPEAIYLDVNITHYDYTRRSNDGLGLLEVEVWTLQVMQNAGMALSNTASPSSAGQSNGGTVQPTAATPTQAAMVPAVSGIGHA